MIDTVQLRHRISSPSRAVLSALGFHIHSRSSTSKTVWIKNVQIDNNCTLRLTWTQTAGGDWLSVETSLPKLLFGRNTIPLQEKNILIALQQISAQVEDAVGVIFDAATAIVGRVDYYSDFQVGETNLSRHLTAATRASFPRMHRHIIQGTVSYGNKSKKIVIYDKHAEVSQSEQRRNVQALNEAKGILRIEARHLKATACRQLKQKYQLTSQTAESLLTRAIAFKEMTATLSALGFDQEILKHDSRIDRLLEFYGNKRLVRPLIAFLMLLDIYGEDFWRLGIAGYSKSMYYQHKRLVKNANALLYAEQSLPALRLSPEMFGQEAIALCP